MQNGHLSFHFLSTLSLCPSPSCIMGIQGQLEKPFILAIFFIIFAYTFQAFAVSCLEFSVCSFWRLIATFLCCTRKKLLYKTSLKRKRSKCFNFSCFIAQETLRDILTACWKNCDISAFLLASSSKIIDLKSKGMATKYSKMSYFLLF